MLLSQEREFVECMVDLVFKFYIGRELFLDSYSGTFATAKVWLKLPDHLMIVGCENYFGFCQDVLLQLVDVFARLVLSEDCEMTGSDGVVEAVRVFV